MFFVIRMLNWEKKMRRLSTEKNEKRRIEKMHPKFFAYLFLGTLLEVQPRLSTDDSSLSNDEIAYELAEHILGRLGDKMDIDHADRSLFEVSRTSVYVLLLGI